MLNGKLEMWLHPGEADMQLRRLNFLESINIAIDVASALLYLHRHCQISVVDFDPKPSNVLLDNYLIAHVSEYGLVRLFSKSGKEAFLNEFSSVGWREPLVMLHQVTLLDCILSQMCFITRIT